MLGSIENVQTGYRPVLRNGEEIGAFLKSLRLAKNMTIEELADEIGYCTKQIQRDEKYGVDKISKIELYADYYGVTPQSIMFK